MDGRHAERRGRCRGEGEPGDADVFLFLVCNLIHFELPLRLNIELHEQQRSTAVRIVRRRYPSRSRGWRGRDGAFRPTRRMVIHRGRNAGMLGEGGAAPRCESAAPAGLMQAGWLEQQFWSPAHLIRSFGLLPDGSCPNECIGMLHAPTRETTIGGENFGAAETRCVEQERLRVGNSSDCLHRTVSRTKVRCQTFSDYMKQS
ncbi:hypothetical protein [Burkholderia territorii]|uniref:hypothetical protein n=1 Tax=Burkholderia territorii TaxID=1503055 RepID=UPI0018C7B6ED|nr:hypothetical protein [Burkholderia territorii]